MLTEEELRSDYERSQISSAEIYREVWRLVSEGKKELDGRWSLWDFISVGGYINQIVPLVYRDDGNFSSIETHIERYLEKESFDSDAVLSAGCSTAADLMYMRGKYPCAQLVGLDIAPYALQSARLRNLDAHFVCASSTHMPFRDSCFDTIIAGHLFDAMTEKDESGNVIDRTSMKDIRGINEWKQTFREFDRCTTPVSVMYGSSTDIEDRWFKDYLPGWRKSHADFYASKLGKGRTQWDYFFVVNKGK